MTCAPVTRKSSQISSTMSAKTPLTFADLPAELRLIIWELAASVRTSRPGLHFIPVSSKPQSTPPRPPKRLSYSRSRMDNNPYPVTITGVDLSSIAGNWSEYLLDAGLWTACRDSREAMIKKWKEGKKKYIHNADPTRRDLTPQRVGIFCEGDKTYGFTVNPRTDLICLQIPEDVVYNSFDSRSKLPFWNDSWYGWCGPKNVAFEYDSSWAFDPNKETIAELRKRPGPRACFLNLMIDSIEDFEGREHGTADYPFILVDRSIQKKSGCQRYFDDKDFHAQGRTFGGVWNERDLMKESSTSSMNAVEFLDMLEAIPGAWRFRGFDDEAGREVRKNGDLWEWIDVEIKDYVSVYACEATKPQLQGV